MNLTKLNQANAIYKALQNLDKEVLKIEKLASTIINNSCKLSLRVENLDKKEEDKTKVSFDEDGSLVVGQERPSFESLFFPGFYASASASAMTENKKNEHTEKINFELTDKEALFILQGVLQLKYAQRDELLASLRKLGVTI